MATSWRILTGQTCRTVIEVFFTNSCLALGCSSETEFVVVRGFEYEYWEEGHYTSNSVYRCFAISADQQDGVIR